MTPELQPTPLPRNAPEAQGISSADLLAFVDAARENIHELHSLMLLRHGHVVAEGWWSPYAPERPHMLFSLSKSFTSTAAGLAIAEGRFSLDDTVLSFFPEDAPARISPNLAAMRVRDLLSMSTGHAEDTTGPMHQAADGNWVRAFLERPVEHVPGTHFLYNSGATYMVSAIVQKLTGITVLEYLTPRLLTPLGIVDATWESCPRGINTGGWGMKIKTEDIARFGQLYLQKGVWNGKRLVSEEWIEQATGKQVSNGTDPESDWNQGYGFQFWRCRHNAYRGDGAFGQFCLVLPEQDAVLALTGGVGDLQGVLNTVWKHLLPVLGTDPLPEDGAAEEALRARLADLKLSVPEGTVSSPLAARVSGRTYRFEANEQGIESIRLDLAESASGAGEWRIRVRDAQGEHCIACGLDGAWLQGETAFDTPGPRTRTLAGNPGTRPVAAGGAWPCENTFVAKLSFYETPFCPTLTFRFEEDRLRFTFRANVAFGPAERPELVGRAIDGQ